MIAIRIALDTDGFTYRKWGSEQRCKAGDWLVSNDGEVYTVDADSFQRTYRPSGDGLPGEAGWYAKSAPVWARIATEAGSLPTKEGASRYDAGDYIVFNGPDETDGYAVGAARFAEMYEPDD